MSTDEIQPPPFEVTLTRENLRSGSVRDMIAQHDKSFVALSDGELRASRASMFPPDGKPKGDVWLFGYGSLIWNPAIEFAEKSCVTVRGYHRRFCLRTELGRGTPEAPGLVLGLDRGGVCRGVAFRIPHASASEELGIVWRREMVTAAYEPRWLKAEGPDGPLNVLGFVMNRENERYTGKLSEDETARMIARAHGFLGPCRDYLFNTVDHLRDLGMPDAGLERISHKVRTLRAG